MIILFVLIIIVIVALSKQTKKDSARRIKLEMEENFQNIPKNDNYDNVILIANYTIKYNLNPVDLMAVTNEKIYGVMGYNLRQLDLILMLLYFFEYDITNNGFVQENELEFEIQNENALIIVFNNRFE